MFRIAYALVMSLMLISLLLVAGCVSPAIAQPRFHPPRYEQSWHRHWQQSPRWRHRDRRAWRREVRRAWPQRPQEDRGKHWHGYRSE